MSYRPSMFLPIPVQETEPSAAHGRHFAEPESVSHTMESRVSNALIRLPRPFMFASQESGFVVPSPPRPLPHLSYSPTAYPQHSPPFVMRDVGHGHGQGQRSYVAVEEFSQWGPPSRYQPYEGDTYHARFMRQQPFENGYHSRLQDLDEEEHHGEEGEVKHKPSVAPEHRHDNEDDKDDEDDDETVVIVVDDDDDDDGEQVVRGRPLGEVDTRNLNAEQVLFYFNVLALKERHLQPAFEYTQDPADGRWVAKLTLYRDSLKLPHMKSLVVAKVEICRVALSILKVRYADWRVPDEPSLDLTAKEWRWFSLLQEYTKETKLPSPEYTRYVHRNGFRYEVAVGNTAGAGTVTAMGKRRFYVNEDQAIEAAAHQVLYLSLTRELREFSEVTGGDARLTVSPGTPTPPDRNSTAAGQDLLTQIKNRAFPGRASSPAVNKNNVPKGKLVANPAAKPPTGPANRVTKPPCPRPGRGRGRGRGRKRKDGKDRDIMSNLRPVVNPRISMNPIHDEPEQAKKWNTSPGSLSNAMKGLTTNREKFDKICNVLGLKPTIEMKQIQPISGPAQLRSHSSLASTFPWSSSSSTSSFTVWVTFQDDPFLARAGPIGKVECFRGTQAQAQEACCKKAIDYVLDIVNEDHALEQEEQAQKMSTDNFVDTKVSTLKEIGQWNASQ